MMPIGTFLRALERQFLAHNNDGERHLEHMEFSATRG
jgi:hypothetical protein